MRDWGCYKLDSPVQFQVCASGQWVLESATSDLVPKDRVLKLVCEISGQQSGKAWL